MKIIKKLSELIDEELSDAEKYARCALKYSMEFPELSQTFMSLSREEMHHKDMLHAQVVKLIEKHRAEHGDPPVAMMAVYDYLHEKAIEKAHEVAMLHEQYKMG